MSCKKDIALNILDELKSKINEIVDKYNVRSKLLENGAIYYMNGNDGTDFDWQVNNHLCEFFTYYDNESKRGFCKIVLNKDGTASIFIFKDGAIYATDQYDIELCSVDEARFLGCLMYRATDAELIWDENIDNIDFSVVPFISGYELEED